MEKTDKQQLIVTVSPHIKSEESVTRIMGASTSACCLHLSWAPTFSGRRLFCHGPLHNLLPAF